MEDRTDHNASNSSIQLLRKSYIKSLDVVASSLEDLAKHLFEKGFLTSETADQIATVEKQGGDGTTEGKELLLGILVSLGISELTNIRKCIRDYNNMMLKEKKDDKREQQKLTSEEEVKPKLHVDKQRPKPKPRSVSPSHGGKQPHEQPHIVPQDPKLHHIHHKTDPEGKKRTYKPHETNNLGLSPMESFSVLFYTLLMKLITSYEKSSTLKTRLTWLRADVPTSSISTFFSSHIYTGDYSVNNDSITISLQAVLETFKTLCDTTALRNEKRTVNNIEQQLRDKDKQIVELREINKQWAMECDDKIQIITALQEIIERKSREQENVGGVIIPRGDTNEVTVEETVDDLKKEVMATKDEYEKVLQELEIARKKLSESEAEIRQCVRSEENKMTEEIEKSSKQCEELVGNIKSLELELKNLQETNEALVSDIQTMREETESDKSHIEELKDQIANYRLNAKSREPSIHEMTLLLKSNRELEKKFKVVEGERDAHKQEKIKLTTQIQTLKRDSQVLLHDKNALKREVDEMKNEIAFYKAHVEELRELIHERGSEATRNKLYSPTKGATPSHKHIPHSRIDLMTTPSVSFRTQQRKCPICGHVFMKLSESEFLGHVAQCFQ